MSGAVGAETDPKAIMEKFLDRNDGRSGSFKTETQQLSLRHQK